MGIDVNRIKLVTFLASAITGLCGRTLRLLFAVFPEPGYYNWTVSAEWLIIVFVGGINSLTGAMFSAVVLNQPAGTAALRLGGATIISSHRSLTIDVNHLAERHLRRLGNQPSVEKRKPAGETRYEYRHSILRPARSDWPEQAFGGVRAVEDFSFNAQPGEIVGIIGPNGAGKTTAFNLVTGVYT